MNRRIMNNAPGSDYFYYFNHAQSNAIVQAPALWNHSEFVKILAPHIKHYWIETPTSVSHWSLQEQPIECYEPSTDFLFIKLAVTLQY